MHNTNACKAGGALSAHPEMAEARNLATEPGFVEEQAERNTGDCRGQLSAEQFAMALAQLRAKLTPRGWTVGPGSQPGSVIAIRWGRLVTLADMQAAGEFTARVLGGAEQ